jgi:hypothetical protein
LFFSLALELGNYSAAKMALDNGADVNKAGKSGALLYRRKEFSFLFCKVLKIIK